MRRGSIIAPAFGSSSRPCDAAESRRSIAPVRRSTVQEEIGLRGAQTSAFAIDPHVGIAVDVTHATDCPTIEKKQQGEIRLGGGPVVFRGPNMNPAVSDRLIASAEADKIPYQLAAIGRATSNDANTLQINRSGVATGLVSVPNRYMHSPVETVSLDDLDHAADLLAAFVGDSRRRISRRDDGRRCRAAGSIRSRTGCRSLSHGEVGRPLRRCQVISTGASLPF